MTELALISLSQIIQACQEQTANFVHRRISDTRYCFELFRRALGDRDNDAINAVYDIYREILERKAARHYLIEHTNESAEYFALMAFRTFQFAIHAEKLTRFTDLSHLLKYLMACVDTSIKQYVRRFHQDELLEPDQDVGYMMRFEDRLGYEKLWQHIRVLLTDDDSILLAYCIYVHHMKPQEIVDQYRHIWPDTDAVRVHRQKITRKLHNDPKLRTWQQQ